MGWRERYNDKSNLRSQHRHVGWYYMSGYFVARATRGHVDGIQGWGGGGGGEVIQPTTPFRINNNKRLQLSSFTSVDLL